MMQHRKRVLIIGQYPKEIGGSQTTGAGNVIYELCRQQFIKTEVAFYGTNAKQRVVEKYQFPNKLYGFNYITTLLTAACSLVFSPFNVAKELYHYMKCHFNVLRFFFYSCNIRRVIKDFSPDAIHVHSTNLIAPAFFAQDGNNIPIILTIHGLFYGKDPNYSWMHDEIFNNLKFVNHFTVLNEAEVEDFKKTLNISDVTIIPNGVDTHKFYFSKEERLKLRKENNISDTDILLLTVASIQKRKGQCDFLDVIACMDKKFKYWVVGNGSDVALLEKKIKDKGLESRVKHVSYVNNSELYRYYSAADVYAHTSSQEGQALSEIEARACGLPIIVNDKIKKTVIGDYRDNETYYVLDFLDQKPDDIEEWCTHPRTSRNSSTAYSWKCISEKYDSFYQSVLY